MSQSYARDLAITAVICFVGGVGLTLLVVLICYRVSHRKKVKENKLQQEEEEKTSRVMKNYVGHSELGGQPLDTKTMMLNSKLENHAGQFWSRADDDRNHFRCLDCSTKGERGMGQTPMRWRNGINRETETEEERQKRRMRMMTQKEGRKSGTQSGILSRDIPNKLLSPGNSSCSPYPQMDNFGGTLETLSADKRGREMDSYRTDVEVVNSRHEILHCKSCHRTYRPPEQTMRSGRIHTNMTDSVLFDFSPFQHRNDHYNMMRNSEWRRDSKNVKFDLECLRTLKQGNIQEDKMGKKELSSRDKGNGRKKKQKAKIQSSRAVKVKLMLSPLRKSKVHPKRTDEQSNSNKSSSKTGKEKKQDGKGREGKEGKRNSKKTKVSSEKKSTKSTEEEKKEEGGGEEKSKSTSKQKKSTSKNEQSCQDDTAAHQDENTHPDGSGPAAEQSAPALVAQGQSGGTLYKRAGLALGQSVQPLSLSASEKNTSLSLLGSAGSALSQSLQGGSILLNATTPVSQAMFPIGPASSIPPKAGSSGLNLTSTGVVNSLSGQTVVDLMSPVTAHLAKTVHANPLQANAIQTTPLQKSQAGGLAPNYTANRDRNPLSIQPYPQSQLFPHSSALAPKLKHESIRGPGLQTGEGLHLPAESEAPGTKEQIPDQVQVPISTDGLSGFSSQAVDSVIMVENLSNNNSQIGTRSVPEDSIVNTLTGGVVQSEGPAVGGSGEGTKAVNVSLSGNTGTSLSPQVESSTDAAAAAGAVAAGPSLLQQEYMAEEGAGALRRKLKLVLPEKTSSRPPTALERKIR